MRPLMNIRQHGRGISRRYSFTDRIRRNWDTSVKTIGGAERVRKKVLTVILYFILVVIISSVYVGTEYQNDRQNRINYKLTLHNVVKEFSEFFPVMDVVDWRYFVKSKIDEIVQLNYDLGIGPNYRVEAWNYLNAFVFVVSTTTTIGYGYPSPNTAAGRIITIVLCITGIPFAFMALTDIVDLILVMEKFIWLMVKKKGAKPITNIQNYGRRLSARLSHIMSKRDLSIGEGEVHGTDSYTIKEEDETINETDDNLSYEATGENHKVREENKTYQEEPEDIPDENIEMLQHLYNRKAKREINFDDNKERVSRYDKKGVEIKDDKMKNEAMTEEEMKDYDVLSSDSLSSEQEETNKNLFCRKWPIKHCPDCCCVVHCATFWTCAKENCCDDLPYGVSTHEELNKPDSVIITSKVVNKSVRGSLFDGRTMFSRKQFAETRNVRSMEIPLEETENEEDSNEEQSGIIDSTPHASSHHDHQMCKQLVNDTVSNLVCTLIERIKKNSGQEKAERKRSDTLIQNVIFAAREELNRYQQSHSDFLQRQQSITESEQSMNSYQPEPRTSEESHYNVQGNHVCDSNEEQTYREQSNQQDNKQLSSDDGLKDGHHRQVESQCSNASQPGHRSSHHNEQYQQSSPCDQQTIYHNRCDRQTSYHGLCDQQTSYHSHSDQQTSYHRQPKHLQRQVCVDSENDIHVSHQNIHHQNSSKDDQSDHQSSNYSQCGQKGNQHCKHNSQSRSNSQSDQQSCHNCEHHQHSSYLCQRDSQSSYHSQNESPSNSINSQHEQYCSCHSRVVPQNSNHSKPDKTGSQHEQQTSQQFQPENQGCNNSELSQLDKQASICSSINHQSSKSPNQGRPCSLTVEICSNTSRPEQQCSQHRLHDSSQHHLSCHNQFDQTSCNISPNDKHSNLSEQLRICDNQLQSHESHSSHDSWHNQGHQSSQHSICSTDESHHSLCDPLGIHPKSSKSKLSSDSCHHADLPSNHTTSFHLPSSSTISQDPQPSVIIDGGISKQRNDPADNFPHHQSHLEDKDCEDYHKSHVEASEEDNRAHDDFDTPRKPAWGDDTNDEHTSVRDDQDQRAGNIATTDNKPMQGREISTQGLVIDDVGSSIHCVSLPHRNKNSNTNRVSPYGGSSTSSSLSDSLFRFRSRNNSARRDRSFLERSSRATISSLMEEEVEDDTQEVSLAITFINLLLYIFLGALMYVFEEKWDYLTAVYYIFTSISTIGFGDVMPQGGTQLFFWSSLYILCGLAFLGKIIHGIRGAMLNFMLASVNKVEEVGVKLAKSISHYSRRSLVSSSSKKNLSSMNERDSLEEVFVNEQELQPLDCEVTQKKSIAVYKDDSDGRRHTHPDLHVTFGQVSFDDAMEHLSKLHLQASKTSGNFNNVKKLHGILRPSSFASSMDRMDGPSLRPNTMSMVCSEKILELGESKSSANNEQPGNKQQSPEHSPIPSQSSIPKATFYIEDSD